MKHHPQVGFPECCLVVCSCTNTRDIHHYPATKEFNNNNSVKVRYSPSDNYISPLPFCFRFSSTFSLLFLLITFSLSISGLLSHSFKNNNVGKGKPKNIPGKQILVLFSEGAGGGEGVRGYLISERI
jgi:hypothetical protein